ncbi:hypothetical protein GCM10022243_55550 [Saccharothrix violaceirubra]|uniref:Tetratricopeptide repeat protein n=1 Tax=Saccharothrix violaceirubra TaxID=413306 RepID=A0A7W7T868_9PSEU|nr:tetratricopeptide repeat protein [Saccharothrix violaceirubra]MBB4967065.1 hypothetical protein [Saccharothrix violaceirubra]
MAKVPNRVGVADIEHLERSTAFLRELDYREGGESCRDRASAVLAWSEQLSRARCTTTIRTRLSVALGDLANLVAWTCFDTGLTVAAQRYWDLALEYGADSPDLVANVHYRVGRMRLHAGERHSALRAFDAGLASALSSHTAAILQANCAWVHAGLGDHASAMTCLGAAMSEFSKTRGPVPGWARFFDETDLSAMTGMVHSELARTVSPSSTGRAIQALSIAVRGYGPGATRSRVFSLIALAGNHLREGDADEALRCGTAAMASRVGSGRVLDRLIPLRLLAERNRGDADARELATRLREFTTRD